MVPDKLNITLQDALEESADLKQAYDSDPQVRELIDLADEARGPGPQRRHARGRRRHRRPAADRIRPLADDHRQRRSHHAMGWRDVEQAGLLKMDFLGLRNLTILDKAVRIVRKHRGLEIDPVKFPLDDAETFALLRRGETKGIFQLESGGIRDLLKKMKPDHFRDIIATNALYRPGPLEGGMVMTYVQVKHGREPIPKVHPIVDEILDETHGVMVYQEQVMRILNRLGGIELSTAYSCIKAISKKKLETIAKFREEFIAGVEDGRACRRRRPPSFSA